MSDALIDLLKITTMLSISGFFAYKLLTGYLVKNFSITLKTSRVKLVKIKTLFQ